MKLSDLGAIENAHACINETVAALNHIKAHGLKVVSASGSSMQMNVVLSADIMNSITAATIAHLEGRIKAARNIMRELGVDPDA